MSDRFDPFADLIDPDRALAILREATLGAEDGELFLERARGESLVFDDGRLRSAGYNASQGFGLRAVRGESVGYGFDGSRLTGSAGAAFEDQLANSE